ncbi:MAG: ribonuclease P protein component [Kiritimatiellae bacterium]|nr:ribonuclease P protein component [Kiritimatiellia bacterium]
MAGNTSDCGSTVAAESPRRRLFAFPKTARIASRADFERIYASPLKKAGKFVVVWVARGSTEQSRLGVAAAKKTFHDAHERNRAKRLVRESFRRLRPSFCGGAGDVAVAARRRILSAKEQQVRKDLANAGFALGFLEPHSTGEPQ